MNQLKQIQDFRIREYKSKFFDGVFLYIPEIKLNDALPYNNDGFIPLSGYVHTTFKLDYSLENIGSVTWAANQLLDFSFHRLSIWVDFYGEDFPSKRNER